MQSIRGNRPERLYADMPPSPPDEEEKGGFEWHPPRRILMPGIQPAQIPSQVAAVDHPQRILTSRLPEVRGRWNNADVYVVAPPDWVAAEGSGVSVRASLSVIVQGAPYPVSGMQNVHLAALPDRVESSDGSFRVYALAVRGRVCDGFRVDLHAQQDAVFGATPRILLSEGQLMIFAWGQETATSSSGSIVPNPVFDVQLSTAPVAVDGTAGSGSSTVIVGVPTPLVQGVQLSAAKANTDTIFVSFDVSGTRVAAELSAGDSIFLPVADASTVFVKSNSGTQRWAAALYA